MSIFSFSHKANPAACSANAEYITRDKACDGLELHNLDELQGVNKLDTKSNFIAYAEMRQTIEAGTRKNFKPKFDRNGKDITPVSRNHFRAVFSWDRKEDSAEALRQAKEFLQKEMPNCKAVLSVHQNTENTHIHCWFDVRGLDGKKLQIDKPKFKTMGDRWTKSYDREYGTDYLPAYQALKKETREWKKAYAIAKEKGMELPPKPLRFTDFHKEYNKSKELQKYGLEQTRINGDERIIAVGQPAIETSKRRFEQSKRTLGQRTSNSRQSEQTLERAADTDDRTERTINEALLYRDGTRTRTRSVVIGRVDRSSRGDDGRGR
jgi:hypothetical protein